MMEIKGKVNTALCFAKVIEDEAIEQIRRMCDYPIVGPAACAVIELLVECPRKMVLLLAIFTES